ncbi:MAG: murein biosynthesis integral membrane protein MurJ [Candidatus Sericytochromatia bacterium]|nr:murein biosynthesis integral membrane protein MurJ [Candidatus Sericytochromatia bacterium]
MSILRAASWIAVLTLASKVVAYGRDATMAHLFGATGITDAYAIAYTLPGFALVMLGGLNGPFHSAVVSILGRYDDEAERRTILETLAVITAVSMGILSVIGIWATPTLVRMMAPNLPPASMAMTISMTQIMFPMFFLAGLIGISYGVLNLRQQYTLPSLSPAIASLTIIIAMVAWGHSVGPLILAWATLVGAVGQLLMQLIPLAKGWRPARIQFAWRHLGVRSALHLIVPAALSSTIGQAIILVHTFFASGLPEGSWAAVNYANRLQQLPLGTLLTAVLVPMLPILTKAAQVSDNHAELRRHTNQGLRSLIVMTFPLAILLSTMAQPIIRVLFQRGAFDGEATLITGQILAILNLSLMAYALRDLLVRVFYALGDSKIPFYTSFVSVVLVAVLDYFLIPWLGDCGVAATTTLVTFANMGLLGWLLRRRIGRIVETETWRCLGMVGIASVPLLIGGFLLAHLSNGLSSLWTLIGLSAGGSLLGAVYVGLLLWFKLPEASSLLARLQSKLRSRKAARPAG